MSKDKIISALEETVDEIYLSLKYSFKDITVFPGEPLKVPLIVASSVTFVSLVCWLFNWIRFTHWVGSLVGTLILAILYYVGKEEGNGKSKSIRSDEGDVELSAGREESASSEREVVRREEYAELLRDAVRIDAQNDGNS